MINLIIFIVLCSNLIIHCSSAVSTIKFGDQFNLTSHLVSHGSRFTLGFFTIPETSYTYLGIWYTHDKSSTKVWVANRSTPITSNPSVLMIDPNTGKLIIATGGTTLVNISDNQSGPSHNLAATLQDTGDFQLINETDNRILWKSFDYPTNVLLPGMKLGSDLTTGHDWELTSWVSDKIPDLGAFTLSWEPYSKDSLRLVIGHRGRYYWWYPYVNNKWSGAHRYNISYADNQEERYFTYHRFTSGTPMWILTPNGQVLDGETRSRFLGSPDFCYGQDRDGGCMTGTNWPLCRSGSHDRFKLLNGEFTGGILSSDNNSSLSTSDCMKRCWDDCTCLAFNSRDNGVGCDIWTGTKNVKFSVIPRGTSVQKYVLVSPSKGKARIMIWGAVVSGIFLLLLCLGLLWYLKNRKLRREEERGNEDYRHLLELMDSSDTERGGRKGSDMVVFSFAAIVTATDDFSDENKLGHGGFGLVYKGRLSDEREVAIKRLSKTSGRGLVEFKNELILVAKLQHKNLVKVLGGCIHGEEKMLITEYMPNKGLDFFLFDETRKTLLDWPKRWNIIEGIAQGLLYLHKYSRMRVIHRDLKASNILLDESMNPKISDFSMARILKQDETEAITKRVVGTYGYMSPEYAMDGTFSVKSDVFSFGVLILEIVSGRRNTRFSHLDKTINLIGYAWELWQQGDALQLQDPTLADSCVVHQLSRTIHVALLCVQESAGDRPVMSDVISMLINDTMPLPVPKRPAFL
ncbi:hypothetical protein L1987_73708 [Smallanthus sonchifolius]|uniref:Uncharacterized protein n=1 Tax=Smallanthus sonchifolius TaxID=185202 RepID=A0ACB9A152_9ASTR|nr:hypothetical protein L1987_73708 [Smallanthus sonchifolius]